MMNFEKVFDKHKEDLTQTLVLFGEGVRVNKLLVDEERKRPDYYKFYEKGHEDKNSYIAKLLQGVVEGLEIELNYAKSMGNKQAEVAYRNSLESLSILKQHFK